MIEDMIDNIVKTYDDAVSPLTLEEAIDVTEGVMEHIKACLMALEDDLRRRVANGDYPSREGDLDDIEDFNEEMRE